MILIKTRFVSATNTKPARIIADDGRGHKIIFSYNHEHNNDFNCELAAIAIAAKFQWGNIKYAGTYKEDRYYSIG